MAAAANPSALFPATAWTMVRHAREAGEEQAAVALEVLCAAYWQPVRQYLTALGCRPDEAADVTQDFFASFLKGNGFTAAAPARGRLRTLLKLSAKHHLFSHWRRTMALKRGGGAAALTLEDAELENGAPVAPEADAVYDRDWAVTVMNAALRRLQQSYAQRGREAVFEVIKGGLLRPGGLPDDADAARRLGIPESQVRLAVHRARQRLQKLLREEVAQTADADAVDEELRYLLEVLLQAA